MSSTSRSAVSHCCTRWTGFFGGTGPRGTLRGTQGFPDWRVSKVRLTLVAREVNVENLQPSPGLDEVQMQVVRNPDFQEPGAPGSRPQFFLHMVARVTRVGISTGTSRTRSSRCRRFCLRCSVSNRAWGRRSAPAFSSVEVAARSSLKLSTVILPLVSEDSV